MSELLLLGSIGGERVAFRAADVQSVMEVDRITPAPMTPPWVVGLTALRSRALTVIDSALSLELPGASQNDTARSATSAIVVEQDKHLYALLVDAISDVSAATAAPVAPPTRLSKGWERCSLGLVETSCGPMLMIDPLAVIAGPDQAEAA
jgi:purine-binding chemotaxis protein CheW